MAAKLQEISVVYDREKFRFENANGDMIIAEARLVNGSADGKTDPWVTIKGNAEVDELTRGSSYRLYGKFVSYTNKRSGRTEKQFAFQTFVESQPHGKEGIVAYLCKAGAGNNIGKATASKIFDMFGEDSVRMLREEPYYVSDRIARVKTADVMKASAWLSARKELEDVTIGLTNLMTGRGFPKTTARDAIRKWGNLASKVIKRNPFVLMAFRACGFKRCDGLYLDLGLRPERLLRQSLCAWYSVASNNDGHTWFPVEHAVRGLSSQVSGAKIRPSSALKLAKKIAGLNVDAKGALAFTRTVDGAIVESGGKVWTAEARKDGNEQRLAELVANAECESGESLWPDVASVENIDEHQREALSKATSSGSIGILGGGPGTGKTFTAANLIKAIADEVGYDNIAVAAPTGKAAVRITEVMDGYGVPLKARTWHSLLGVRAEAGSFSFSHDQSNPWTYKVIIGDETSMNDTNLMASVMAARARGCHMLLIGDVNQLPPVGHGAPLRDMIAANVGYGELTEIKRNSGGIVEACAAIRWSCHGDIVVSNFVRDRLD